MEPTDKYWIPVFNILEKPGSVTLAHPKHTKPQKGDKANWKDVKWIYALFMYDMIKPSFISSPEICQLRCLVRYRDTLTNMLIDEKSLALKCRLLLTERSFPNKLSTFANASLALMNLKPTRKRVILRSFKSQNLFCRFRFTLYSPRIRQASDNYYCHSL